MNKLMNAQNIFLFIAVILTVIIATAAVFAWRPEANPFLFLNEKADRDAAALAQDAQSATPTPTGKSTGAVSKNGYTVYTVTYDGHTFSPRILVIDRGETVRFVNTTGGTTMRVDVQLLGNVPSPARYTESDSVGKGGAYELNFNQPGVWSFVNMNGDTDANGIVYVRDVQ